MALTLLFNGRPGEALTELEDVLARPDLAADLRDATELTWFVGLFSQQDIWRGRQRAEAIVTAREHHGDGALVGALVLLMHIAWAEGRVAGGLGLVREAARIAGRGSIGAHSIGPRLNLAICLLNVRLFTESEDVLHAADEQIGRLGHTLQSAGAAYVRAYLRLAAGQLDDAAAEAEAGLETADEPDAHTLTPTGILVLATVSLLRGDLSAAAHHVRRYRAHSARGLAFPAGWATAAVAEARGGPGEAMRVLRTICPDVAMWRWHLVAESNLAAWGTRVALAAGDRAQAEMIVATMDRIARDNPGFPALTHAEAHACGILDRNAAARMFVLPHTVKFHLRQVFRKLDIGSRVEPAHIITRRNNAS